MPGTVALRWQPVRLTTVAGGLPRLQTQGTLQGLPWPGWMRSAWTPPHGRTQHRRARCRLHIAHRAHAGAATLLARLGWPPICCWKASGTWTPPNPLRATASLRRTQGDLRILSAEPPAETASVSTGQGWGRAA